MSTAFGGLSRFHLTPDDVATTPWRSWPHLSLSSDQGSDQLSAAHALQFFSPVKCNVTPFWDAGHGSNRDFWNTVSEMNLNNFAMLMLIVINLPHGPEESDLRFQQIRQVMEKHYATLSPALSPIFQKFARRIDAEFGDTVSPAPNQTREEALWEAMQCASHYKRKGYKTNKGRFHAVVADGLGLVRSWYTTLFEVTVPTLELDMVQKVALPKIRLATTGADEGASASTSAKHVSVGDRTLRTCGVNAMVISLAMLSDSDHHRRLAIFFAIRIYEGLAR